MMMDFSSGPTIDIEKSVKHLKIHEKVYVHGGDGGILLDHIMSLKHGLEFLGKFLRLSYNEDLQDRIEYMVSSMEQKLYLLRCLRKDESLVMNLEHAYADLREEMKNVIMKPGTNEYDVILPESWKFALGEFRLVNDFLCEKLEELVTLDCKADLITPLMKELEDMGKMFKYFKAFFDYEAEPDVTSFSFESENEGGRSIFRAKSKDEHKIFSTITKVIDRATCFIYMLFIGKMDKEMALSLKNSLSELIIEETVIMSMYLSLDAYYIGSHTSMTLMLLEWNKECCLGMVMGGELEDHFMSIKHGLQFLSMILQAAEDIDLKLRIRHLVATVNEKLYSLSHNHEDGNLIVKLEHAYSALREEMQNVVIKPGTNDYHRLISGYDNLRIFFRRPDNFLLEEISILATSSCKADQIALMMKELEEIRKMLTLLKPFVYDVSPLLPLLPMENDIDNIAVFLSFIDRATCLIYLSFVGTLNEDMLVSLRRNFSLLIEETEIKKLFLYIKSISVDELVADIDISLSLLKRQEGYHIATADEAMLEVHLMSVKHGLEFVKFYHRTYLVSELTEYTARLAGNVKKLLESRTLSYKQEDENLNRDVNGVYADLREDTLIQEFHEGSSICRYRGDSDFLVEKITTLVTSNCKADQIAPLLELQEPRKILTLLKPLSLYTNNNEFVEPFKKRFENELAKLSTAHHAATICIYLAFVGEMDIERVLFYKSMLSAAIKETDVLELYTTILHCHIISGDYLEKELYLLHNLILFLENNFESLNDACSKLFEVLIDIHAFLLGLYPNVFSRKLHILLPSIGAILGHSIPILCSCYLEHTEVDISAELNHVLDLIKHIKSEVREIKLYYLPKIDDFDFLEFFSGYLEDLLKNQEISMKEEIDALHFEVHSLLSLAKVTNQELHQASWTDITNMAYQAEYIIDLYLASSSTDLELISSLSKIIEQLKNIRADLNVLSCKSPPAQVVAVTSEPQVLGTTTQLSDMDAIVDLQEENRNIMEYLLKGENKLDVISITGMAGVGKTTLAMTLYKTPQMAVHFDIIAWCTVSQSYQYRALLLSILDQVDAFVEIHRSTREDEELAEHLCRRLKKRRYLIIFDDIWDTELWNYLKRFLPDDRNGSRILITTRNIYVADQIGSKVNQLHGLSKEKSWELFQKKMLYKESLSGDLLKISKRIVESCKGLPLSIVIIAGILSGTERTIENWNQIEKSVSSFVLSDPQGKCKAILELSFNNLPNHLQSCFLYMGSFPEDQEISVNHLIMRWIAEGLIQDTKSDSLEEVAEKYMENLILKSLVIPAKERSRGGVKTFRLHDLLRDFCLDKAEEKHFFMWLDSNNYSRSLQDPRRLIINVSSVNKLRFSCHSIRSMIYTIGVPDHEIEKRIQSCDMVLLRVFESGYEVWSKVFPDLSSLVHLRYLALPLWGWQSSVLPSSISKLQNLQIFILRCKGKVIQVPNFIWDMMKLRHIHIRSEASFEVDNDRLENSSFLLKNLKSLSKARVSCGDSKWLIKLLELQRLSCVFVEEDDKNDDQVQMLSFNDLLTSLKVENAAGMWQRFLSTCQLPNSLRELTLSKFFLATDISEIGRELPHLEVFKIYNCSVPFRYEWNVDDEDFPELKVLKLRDLLISNWIASENSFLNLEQLWVERCDYLNEIPLDFGSLPKLRLISVKECAPSVDNSAKTIEELQHEEQNTEMRVNIYPRNISHSASSC